MRKSNWIVFAIAIIISAFLLWLWYFMRFNQIDSPLDLVLSIIWWLIIAAAIFLIRNREMARREAVNTCYVAAAKLFNNEKGLMSLQPGEDVAARIQGVLNSLEYNFHMADFPGEDGAEGEGLRKVDFVYVVRTKVFKPKKDDSGLFEWQGEVAIVSRPNDEPRKFDGKAQLQAILEGAIA